MPSRVGNKSAYLARRGNFQGRVRRPPRYHGDMGFLFDDWTGRIGKMASPWQKALGMTPEQPAAARAAPASGRPAPAAGAAAKTGATPWGGMFDSILHGSVESTKAGGETEYKNF